MPTDKVGSIVTSHFR